MPLSNTIIAAVKKARQKAESEGLLVTFTVKNRIGTVYSNGRSQPKYDSRTVVGLFDKFEDHEIEKLQVKSNDSKILLFIDNFAQLPSTDGLLEDETGSRLVISSIPVYVGAVPVITQVHTRK